MDKQRIVRLVLRSSAALDTSNKAIWQTWVNLGGIQELDGIEKFVAGCTTVTPVSIVSAALTGKPCALKVEIEQLPQDGFDSGLNGPSRTVATLEPAVLPGVTSWSSSTLFAQGNVPYGRFTINRAQTNAVYWKIRVLRTDGVAVAATDVENDWEVHIELAY